MGKHFSKCKEVIVKCPEKKCSIHIKRGQMFSHIIARHKEVMVEAF